MKIRIECPDERLEALLPSRPTIQELKEFISERKGYNVEEILIKFGEKILRANALLSSEGIKDGDTVRVLLNRRGVADNFDIPSVGRPWSQNTGTGRQANAIGNPEDERQYPMPNPRQGSSLNKLLAEQVAARMDPEMARRINKLVGMGFDEKQVKVALYMAKGVVQVAASFLPLSREELKESFMSVSLLLGTGSLLNNSDRDIPGDMGFISAKENKSGGNIQQTVPKRQIIVDMVDTEEDVKQREQFLNITHDPIKSKALGLAIRGALPEYENLNTQLAIGAKVEEIEETKKLLRSLPAHLKAIAKELYENNVDERTALGIILNTNGDYNHIVQLMQAQGFDVSRLVGNVPRGANVVIPGQPMSNQRDAREEKKVITNSMIQRLDGSLGTTNKRPPHKSEESRTLNKSSPNIDYDETEQINIQKQNPDEI